MEYDIEAYLEGNLNETDRAAFEAELAANPVFREEVEFQRQVRQGLKQQLLREQVSEVLEKEKKNDRKPGWGSLLGIALLLLAGAFYFFQPKADSISTPGPQNPPTAPLETPATNPPATPTPELPAPPSSEEPTPQKSPKEKQTQRPIAQNNPPQTLPSPAYPGPTVRGAQAGNKAWIKLINDLWYTDFPPAKATFSTSLQTPAQLLIDRNFPRAYVQLQRLERKQAANDTIRYLKGYCLLEMGEGTEAIRYFEGLEISLPQWKQQLEWYRGLAYLISGEREKAMAVFKEIVVVDGHAYLLESKKAVSRLQ